MIKRPHDAFNLVFEEKPHVQEEMEIIDAMISNNKVQLLYDALGQEIVPPSPKKKKQQQQRKKERASGETKTIHGIFDHYLGSEFLDKLRLDYQEIYELFCERAKPLKEEIEEDKPILMEIIDTFVTRMVLNLLTQDKVAIKVRSDMIDRIESLYDHRAGVPISGVKNNFTHYDYVNAIINKRCKEALDQSSDEIYARFSEPKKRGRHPKLRPEEVINEIEVVAGEYIAKRLSLSQAAAVLAANNTTVRTIEQRSNAIDYYPIFKQTLAVYDKCLPKQNNHGFYIQRLMQMIRTLDSRVWPLHGLMSMVNNMNYCVHASTVKMNFDRSKQRFYCCYSGTEIHDGETVTYLRVVENDAERLKEWRENPMMINKPFEAPEFTRSLAAFYMKRELCCASTLLFTPFSESYKAHFPEYFKPVPLKPVATKKRIVKPKRKAEDTDEKKKNKKPRVILSDIKQEACFFDSLSMHATKKPTTTLRHYIVSLPLGDTIPYRDRVWRVLAKTSKKKFLSDMLELIEWATQKECSTESFYEALLDFIEAIIAPEKSISLYAANQKNVGILALLYATHQRIKQRDEQQVNLFMALSTTEEMACNTWLKTYPLFFRVVFDYMVTHEIEPYLSGSI